MKRVGLFSFFFIQILLSSLSSAKILVFEYKPESLSLEHVNDVLWSACGGYRELCGAIYGEDFNEDFFSELHAAVASYDVVNMSFGQVRLTEHELLVGEAVDPSFSVQEYLEGFNAENMRLSKFIEDSKEVLFTAAAGNGKQTALGSVGGVALSSSYKSYPASFEHTNLITVAALAKPDLNLQSLEDHKLAVYSNFSVFDVDIAATPSRNEQGEELLGTSFAAPYVASIAQKIKDIDGSLSPESIKEILMKSSYVVNIENAILASQAFESEGKKSDLYRVHKLEVKSVRDKVMKKLGGIMLVKSGGYLVESVALECAKLYLENGLSVASACLQAHKTVLGAGEKRALQLKELWTLRGL